MEFKRTRKFFKGLRNLLSKWTAEDFRNARVDTGYVRESAASVLYCGYCKTKLPNLTEAELLKHVQACPQNPLVVKLTDATEALRKIECLAESLEFSMSAKVSKMQKLAQDGYGAATNNNS